MSINVSISGEIIESRNYLSNYFVTLTSDQIITGNKTFTDVTNFSNVASFSNVSSLQFTNGKINASTLNISTNVLTFNGNSGLPGQFLSTNGSYPVWTNISNLNISNLNTTIFGSKDISYNDCSGTILFGNTFTQIPVVTITQNNASRIVPLFVKTINTTSFQWGSASKGVGNIMWSAGIKS